VHTKFMHTDAEFPAKIAKQRRAQKRDWQPQRRLDLSELRVISVLLLFDMVCLGYGING